MVRDFSQDVTVQTGSPDFLEPAGNIIFIEKRKSFSAI